MIGLLLLTLQSAAQPVQVLQAPADWQLFPRTELGVGEIVVAGNWLPDASTTTLRLEVQAGEDWVRVATAPSTTESAELGSRAFHLSVSAPAGLVDYEAFLILNRHGADQILHSWSHLTIGDVLIVHGQSNAVAADYYSEVLANLSDQSPWIRSFGNAGFDPLLVAADLDWHIADGEQQTTPGFVGSWGLDLARQIVEREGIPVAVLNGAVGGTTVEQHQRNTLNHEDLDTIYGRLLYRANHAGVADRVRAIFWYQGESDGAHAQAWLDGFTSLSDAWQEDFSGLEHLWIVQVRRGCGAPSLQLRDSQRRLPHKSQRVHGATANGIYQHDGCHFHYASYVSLGAQLGPQVAYHLYGASPVDDSEAPDVLSASWTGSAHTAFFLDFRNVSGSFTVPAGSWTSLAVSDGTPIAFVTAVGNRLRVQLAGNSTAETVSFSGTSGNQTPWIRNPRGLALMSFLNVEIQ